MLSQELTRGVVQPRVAGCLKHELAVKASTKARKKSVPFCVFSPYQQQTISIYFMWVVYFQLAIGS
jgi:hypothetical protein